MCDEYKIGCSDLVLFFRFYHMLVFHELDLLVLRPFVKQTKIIRARPTECTRAPLIIRAGFQNFENIFTKDQRILEKTKIQNSKFIS